MPIKFRCPACQQKIRVADEHAGKQLACPACKAVVGIPMASTLPDGTATLEPVRPAEELAANSPQPQPQKNKSARIGAQEAPRPAPPVPDNKLPFIKFICPGCSKMTGFPAQMAGTPAACPSCKVQLMVPETSGEQSFIVGSAPAPVRAPRPPLIPPLVVNKERHVPHTEVLPPKYLGMGAAAVAAALLLGIGIGRMTRSPATPAIVQKAPDILTRQITQDALAASNAPKSDGTPKSNAPQNENQNEEHPRDSGLSPATKQTAESNAPSKTVVPIKAPLGAEPKSIEAAVTAAEAESSKDIQIAAKPPEPAPPADAASDVTKLLTLNENKKRTAASADDDDLPDVKAIKKESPAANATDAAANPMPEKPVAPAPKPLQSKPKAVELPVVCSQCLGTTFVPNLPFRKYVHMDKDPAASPADALPWKYCPKCQAGKDNKELLAVEADRIAAAPALHAKWADALKTQLVSAETHYITLYGQQLPASSIRGAAVALEQLAGNLQQMTGSTLFTQLRPDTHELLFFYDAAGFTKFIDALAEKQPGRDLSLMREASGINERYLAAMQLQKGLFPAEDAALFSIGHMLMTEATDGKAPPWLSEGFAAYCENSVTKKNLCISFAYEKNDVKFNANWDADIKKYALQSKLKTWDHIFPIDMIGLKPLDYLTCYSMVSFLIKTDGPRFARFVLAIREDIPSAQALEKVYGHSINDLQLLWAKWAMEQR